MRPCWRIFFFAKFFTAFGAGGRSCLRAGLWVDRATFDAVERSRTALSSSVCGRRDSRGRQSLCLHSLIAAVGAVRTLMFGSLITLASGCFTSSPTRQALGYAALRPDVRGTPPKCGRTGNIAGFDFDTGMAGKRLHNRQQGLGGHAGARR